MQKKKNLLETAQRYLEIGFAPIPCHAPHLERKCTCRLGVDCVSPGKHPAIPWQRFQTKKIDKDQLLIWFGDGGMYEDKNIGLITGTISSNIFAIDVDIGPGKDGADSLQQLQSFSVSLLVVQLLSMLQQQDLQTHLLATWSYLQDNGQTSCHLTMQVAQSTQHHSR